MPFSLSATRLDLGLWRGEHTAQSFGELLHRSLWFIGADVGDRVVLGGGFFLAAEFVEVEVLPVIAALRAAALPAAPASEKPEAQ